MGDDDAISNIRLNERRQGLLAAQCANLAARLPLLYCVVLVTVTALAGYFSGAAPRMLTLWIPLAIALAICWRAAFWLSVGAGRRGSVSV